MSKWMVLSAAVAAVVVLLVQAADVSAAVHPACPGDGDCCDPAGNGTPGCEIEGCCNLICDIDPFCCDWYWDSLCASTAISECCWCACGCPLECPPNGLDEGEVCGADTNGGCDSIPPVFIEVECGGSFCGTLWAAIGNRDTDWYLVAHNGGTISVTLESDVPAHCFIMDRIDDCTPIQVGEIGCGAFGGGYFVARASLPAGKYAVMVAPGECDGSGIFDYFPCEMGFSNYVLDIACGPYLGDCEAIPDGVVDVADFLALLRQWGQVGAACDFDGDGVGVTDFLLLLEHWGPCP